MLRAAVGAESPSSGSKPIETGKTPDSKKTDAKTTPKTGEGFGTSKRATKVSMKGKLKPVTAPVIPESDSSIMNALLDQAKQAEASGLKLSKDLPYDEVITKARSAYDKMTKGGKVIITPPLISEDLSLEDRLAKAGINVKIPPKVSSQYGIYRSFMRTIFFMNLRVDYSVLCAGDNSLFLRFLYSHFSNKSALLSTFYEDVMKGKFLALNPTAAVDIIARPDDIESYVTIRPTILKLVGINNLTIQLLINKGDITTVDEKSPVKAMTNVLKGIYLEEMVQNFLNPEITGITPGILKASELNPNNCVKDFSSFITILNSGIGARETTNIPFFVTFLYNTAIGYKDASMNGLGLYSTIPCWANSGYPSLYYNGVLPNDKKVIDELESRFGQDPLKMMDRCSLLPRLNGVAKMKLIIALDRLNFAKSKVKPVVLWFNRLSKDDRIMKSNVEKQEEALSAYEKEISGLKLGWLNYVFDPVNSIGVEPLDAKTLALIPMGPGDNTTTKNIWYSTREKLAVKEVEIVTKHVAEKLNDFYADSKNANKPLGNVVMVDDRFKESFFELTMQKSNFLFPRF